VVTFPKKKFYVTTPIYYTNAPPHIGSAYTTIAADILARFHRLKGENVFFLTGTDEHGKKIQKTAEEKCKKPQEFVDRIVEKFKDLWAKLNISNNNFLRTTDPKHEKEVKNILEELYNKKLIYKGYYEAYYCVGCEQYLTENDLVNGLCPLHKKSPEIKKEEAYLFKLSAFQKELLDLIENDKLHILPKKKKAEILSFIKAGLKDISISRKKSEVYWGIELPFDKNHTVFVWVDAFWNYLTGLEDKKTFNKFWPPDVQLMANDILRVHSTIWPALLLALEIKLPKTLFVHGYFTLDGQKISKSLGNIIDPFYLIDKYGTDSLRYFFIRNIPFGQDGDFSEKLLIERTNNELVANIGNFIHRTLTFLWTNFDGTVPVYKKEKCSPLDKKFDDYIENMAENVGKNLEKNKIDEGLREIIAFSSYCNAYFQGKEPWKTKDRNCLYLSFKAVKTLAVLLEPFIPESSEKLWKQLNLKGDVHKEKWESASKIVIKSGYKINKPEVLFKKIL